MAPAIDIYPLIVTITQHPNWAIGTAILCFALSVMGVIGFLRVGVNERKR